MSALLATIGHNQAPGPIGYAKETGRDLSLFLRETPVIENFDQCRDGDAWIERTMKSLQSMEDERKPLADPVYAQWKAINEPYRAVREPLEKLYTEIRRRVSVFKNKIEAERKAEAERLRREVEEKERLAREAEAREQEAIANAEQGECTDVGAAISEADEKFHDFAVAKRTAERAEREVVVRNPSIAGGKSRSMRTIEVLKVTNAHDAIDAMAVAEGGIPQKLLEALLSCARDHRKACGELPAGIVAEHQRSM